MLSQKRVKALVQQAENEGIDGDIGPVLKRTLTVGELIKYLQQYNLENPVEIEIPVEIEGTDEMTSEVAYVIDIFETPGETNDSDVITLRGCKPDLLEAYQIWESDPDNVDA